jgi:hypothetical protein
MNAPYKELIADSLMNADQSDRPYAYGDPQTQKVVILMTDGEHVAHTRVTDPFKTGPSPIYLSANGNYSVFKPTIVGVKKYYVPHLDAFQATPCNGRGSVTQQDWKDVWATMKVNYVAWQFNAHALGTTSATRNAAYNDWRSAIVSTWKSKADMDTSLQTTCTQARSDDVLVYGIAFEAPAGGAAQILSCSTDSTFFYDASDPERLRGAFCSIATNLSLLQLTQ